MKGRFLAGVTGDIYGLVTGERVDVMAVERLKGVVGLMEEEVGR